VPLGSRQVRSGSDRHPPLSLGGNDTRRAGHLPATPDLTSVFGGAHRGSAGVGWWRFAAVVPDGRSGVTIECHFGAA